ncbi:DUF6268 family outer membrane beta-barrel protein [Pontibacter vulgaris]|uniref:DUF6268 family outer membrane beta-barrel protein n=1 Tax=Pontibacter vulgaris TaxID=2905679 RepID=UPI001FA7D3DD|nr:DUF6268 family outer membrane beta-barrel protein [Pontibacter vulgaris]
MKKISTNILLLTLLLITWHATAQTTEHHQVDTVTYAGPGVEGQPRPRGIVIKYERLPGFDIESESDDPRIGNGEGRVRRHNKFSASVGAPLINRPQTKLIIGFNYELEEFNFEDISETSYSLYRYLEDKNLKSVGLQLAYQHSIDSRKFYLIRAKGELNGDYTRDDINISDYFKGTIDLAYGWSLSPYYSIGVGVEYGWVFGRQRIYPGILYNRTFNDKWGVEAIFPAAVRVRRNVDEKTYLYAGYRLEGGSYDIFADATELQQFGEIELRRTDIKGLLRMEREIYDFVWFAVEGGFRQYYRHRVFEEPGDKDELIKNDLAGAGYIGVELYLVAPRKWMEKGQVRKRPF